MTYNANSRQVESMSITELQDFRSYLKFQLKKVEEILQSKVIKKEENSRHVIIESIENAAEMYDWNKIKSNNNKNKNLLSYIQCKQRINIWIKSKTITIRVQPLEIIFKDIEPEFLKLKLETVNESIINEGE